MEYFSFFAAMSLLTVEDGLAGVEVRTLGSARKSQLESFIDGTRFPLHALRSISFHDGQLICVKQFVKV